MRISDWSSDVCSSDLARQQVHVHAVACAIIADRQTRDQEDPARDQQRYGRVVEPIAERDGRADRLAGEEGDRSQRAVVTPPGRPAARLLRGEATGINLERAVVDPLVILPAIGKEWSGGRGWWN